ncbi:MAG: Hsp20/alpha crystallin family protein [Pseudomonadales bacterium]|nr:Hsp20/alpha crystallin family protein [Pseudomonadales bacterium]
MAEFQNRINQLFGNGWLGHGNDGSVGISWMPAADIFEDDKTVKLSLEIPGMSKKDIEISIDEDRVLLIRGERKLEHEERQDGYTQIERRYGVFLRQFALPRYIDQKSLKASFNDGILQIELARSPEANGAIAPGAHQPGISPGSSWLGRVQLRRTSRRASRSPDSGAASVTHKDIEGASAQSDATRRAIASRKGVATRVGGSRTTR